MSEQPGMTDLGGLRLLHAKGGRAALELLLGDSRLDDRARAVVQDHYNRCEAMVSMLDNEPLLSPDSGAQ